MANIVLTYSSASDALFINITGLLSDQVGGATVVPVRPELAKSPVLLVHIPEQTLQHALEVVSDQHAVQVQNRSSNSTSHLAKNGSSTTAAAAAAAAAAATDSAQPGSGALQDSRCSRLDVTPAEAVLLAITCLERVKVSSRVVC